MTAALSFEDVAFSYGAGAPVLDGFSLSIQAGEMVAFVGANGSGKSTAAKLIDALLLPDAGRVRVFGMDTRCPEHLLSIRASCGMVFQNPDDQIVATLVADEVAFGPRNLGLPDEEVRGRVDEALRAVGLHGLRDAEVDALSGGQRQRVAVAGALAMRPQILILDEATSMLDDEAAAEVIACVERLHAAGMTVIAITHEQRVIDQADRIVCFGADGAAPDAPLPRVRDRMSASAPAALELADVSFAYAPGAPPVFDGFSLTIREGELVFITGPNGCGKSTLLKLANGLLAPDEGAVRVFGQPLDGRHARNEARFKVGLAFQHPERQLFERTVYDDVAFGPRSRGLSPAEVEACVRAAIADVGLAFDEVYAQNPFTLSGGQQRRAAIAGVLALQTPILALDEPCAGLDGKAKRSLMELLVRLNEAGRTIIVVSHAPEDAEAMGARLLRL